MKVAWVTGSAKRLGKALAKRLAQDQYFTWIHYSESVGEARETLKELKAEGGQGGLLRGDISKPSSIAAMVHQIEGESGRLDVLVQNVGIYRTGSVLEIPAAELEHLFSVNTLSSIHLMKATLPLFPKSGGSFIAVGYSGLHGITGSTHNAAYLASKTALLSLIKSLALELGPRQLRVNMVSPGILDNSVELPKRIGDFSSLGRLGRVNDVAEAVAFLASDKAAYITGVNLDVAGGYMVEVHTLKGPDFIHPPMVASKKSKR